MIKKFLVIIFLATFLFSCNNEKVKEPETDMEVARAFVRNILDNKFDEAERYLLVDETNTSLFNRFKLQYGQKDKAILEKYKNADIIINEKANPLDSVFILNYSNSYNLTDKTVLKLLRINGQWLVDLKYTFSGNL